MTTGWFPPIGDQSLKEESLEPIKESPAIPLMNKVLSMAMYALRKSQLKAGACLVDRPMMECGEDLPFDGYKSVENMSQRSSPELALLEAQLVLETEYLAVAKARARCAATVVALTKALRQPTQVLGPEDLGTSVPGLCPQWATIMNLSKKTMFVIPSRMTCVP